MTVFIITISYATITLIIGILVGRNNKNMQQFFVAKNRLTLLLCSVLLMSSTFAGAYTAGCVSEAYAMGFKPYLPIATMAFGYALFFPLVKFFRSMANAGYISIPEAFSVRFDSKVKVALLIINSLMYGAVFAVQPVAFASIVAPMLGIETEIVVWCAAAVITVMALTGLTGVAFMSIIHFVVMVGGLSLLSILTINASGGMAHLIDIMPAQTWNLFQPDVASTIVRVIALTAGMFAVSEAATIAIGAKTRKTAHKGLFIATGFILIFTFLIIMIGISGRVLVPELESSSTALYSIASSISPAISIVASIAVIAAIISSAPAYMIYFSTGVTRDIISRFIPDATDKKMKVVSTIVIILLGIGGPMLAMHAGSILNFLFGVFEIQSICGVVLIIGFYWKRVSAKSALLALIVGAGAATIWMIMGDPFGIIPAWIVLSTGLTTLIVATLAEKQKISNGYARMKLIMDKYPE